MIGQQVNWEECLQHSAMSDVGMRRANNQDAYAVVMPGDAQGWYNRGHLFMVADGMGAHAAGELASKLACDTIPHLYHKFHEKSPPEALQQAVLETNAEVHKRGEENPDFHNMGTTSSILTLLPQGALIAHIGDSRVYRLRGDRLEQLTFDHSLVWEMRASGQLNSETENSAAIPKNVITRSLGPHAKVKLDMEGPFPVEVGDTFLLCSDGLTGKLEDEELAPILASMPPNEAVKVLVDLANLRGGPDNITVIVVRVTGPQISTRVAGGPPLTIGAEAHKELPVPLWLWVTMGVCFLAALGLGIVEQVIPALLAGLVGLVTLLVGILRKFGGTEKEGTSLTQGRRLGKGPHTRTEQPPTPQFAENLAEILRQLKEAAITEGWNCDWMAFQQHQERASTAKDQGRVTDAIRAYGHAISFMMGQLRSQQRAASDSTVDL